MTNLSRPVKRETGVFVKGRPLIIELHQGYATLRQKGKRTTVSVGYAAVLDLGWKLLAREQANLKAAEKKAKKGSK